jgi:cob(I)alamin adenosyltransferase
MSIVTKTGDDGTTGLYGGQRVPKDSARLHAYGTVDELNTILGIVLADEELTDQIRTQLTQVQHLLFRMGGDLATPLDLKSKVDRMGIQHVGQIELWIKEIESSLPPQRRFILPGGTPAAAHLHHARAVCRRAERWMVQLKRGEPINEQAMVFMNRLSDYLFLLARKINAGTGKGDIEVSY